MKYIDELNPKQKEAALATEGPNLILAGAGSGKTKTLIARVAYLIEEKNVAPWKILAVTFSNRAANEMKERMIKMLPDMPESSIQFSTFHSFCVRVLRKQAEHTGLKSNFSTYDDSEQSSIAKAILKRREIDPKKISASSLLGYIDKVKNEGYYLGRKKELSAKLKKQEEMFSMFEEYEKELAINNAIDFGGMITKVLEILETKPEVKEYYNNLIDYLLVDEYQDTNKAQFDLINLLVEKKKNITVIGDDYQSIYSFRGADVKNILEFDKHYPEAKIHKLEQNYRSTKNVIEAANQVIKKNFFRKDKNLWTEQVEGEKIKIIQAFNGDREADFIAQKISALQRNKVVGKNIAVFYRNNSQSRSVEDALRRSMISYRVVGGMRFYERKEIKDMLAYLRCVANPYDEISLIRALQNPSRGVGDKSIEKLVLESRNSSSSLWDHLIKVANGKIKLAAKAQNAIKEFVQVIKKARESGQNGVSIVDIYLDLLDDSGYKETLENSQKYEDQARLDNLQELTSSLQNFIEVAEEKTLSAYLETVTLDQGEEEKTDNQVILMTVHASKGLEFDYVFIVGIEEGIFPSPIALNDSVNGIEEERRLFYVAVTRAKKELYLFCAHMRVLYGKVVQNPPSRFLSEIPSKNYQKFQI